jgi:AcrR family transcriptional regulator
MLKKHQGAGHSDPHVARRRAALARACIELYVVKDFQSLTIAEIARTARVGLRHDPRSGVLQNI